MATQITATLPTLDFPREVDYPTQEDWATFSAAAEENFGILGNGWSTQMQLWKTEANAMSTELNTNATIAQGLANYQGDWVSQGYTLGQSVSVGGIYYVCKLTHVSGQNPTDGGSIYWNLAIGNWNLKVNTDMSGYTSKTTPIDADLLPLSDSAATFGIKKLTWANLKATIMSSFGVMINTLISKTTPVNNDFFVIGDSDATNASKKLTWANLKATLKTYFDTLYSKLTPTIATGTATFTATTNNINLTGIGIGVEIGDVIQIGGADDTKNNSEFTVEVITDANNIIVNQAHANKGTTKNVANRASDDGVTVKLLSKWYNAPIGLGQGWVDMSTSRAATTPYSNNTNRSIGIHIVQTTGTATVSIAIDGVYLQGNGVSASSIYLFNDTIIPKGSTYSATVKTVWLELR